MTPLLAALAALFLAASSGASTFDISVDPRFELLGVVQHLAGLSRTGPDTIRYRQEIDLRFAPFREHPAVALYRGLAATPSGEEASAVLLIYFSPPPELRLRNKDADIHYLHEEGRRETMQRFLWELRDFARASDFMAFFKENEAFYRETERAAGLKLAGVEPAPVIESFLGLDLASRIHYILPMLSNATHNFIDPYPLPPAHAGAGSFDVYTFSSHHAGLTDLWHEAIYVFIDPSFYYFEKLNIPDPAAFYGPELEQCRKQSPECTKQFVVNALLERLKRSLRRPSLPSQRENVPELERRYMKALSERLDEYERNRARYPTLWTFYPRLFSVFHELSHGGKPAKLSVPADAPIRSIADFFDPPVIKRLAR